MKQDIAEYLCDSFIDFKGDTHKIIICALSQSPVKTDGDNLMVNWCDGINVDNSADIYHNVYRLLSLGVAICCPADVKSFSEEIGKKIALNRATNAIPKLVALEPGVINTPLVSAFLKQEMEFIKKYPEKFIKGYEEAKFKYEEKIQIENAIKSLSEEEYFIVKAITDGVDIYKCNELAKQLKNYEK